MPSPVCTFAGIVPSTPNARLQAWPGRVSSTSIYIQALPDKVNQVWELYGIHTCLALLALLSSPLYDLSNPQPRFFTVDAHSVPHMANDRFPAQNTLQGSLVPTVVPSQRSTCCSSLLQIFCYKTQSINHCHSVGHKFTHLKEYLTSTQRNQFQRACLQVSDMYTRPLLPHPSSILLPD